MQFQLQCLMLMHPKKYLLVLWKVLNSTAVDLIAQNSAVLNSVTNDNFVRLRKKMRQNQRLQK